MGGVFSNPEGPPPQPAPQNGVYGKDITITGLGTQWPSVTLTSDEFEKFALSLYPADSDAPWWVKVQWAWDPRKSMLTCIQAQKDSQDQCQDRN